MRKPETFPSGPRHLPEARVRSRPVSKNGDPQSMQRFPEHLAVLRNLHANVLKEILGLVHVEVPDLRQVVLSDSQGP
eukprot:UN3369